MKPVLTRTDFAELRTIQILSIGAAIAALTYTFFLIWAKRVDNFLTQDSRIGLPLAITWGIWLIGLILYCRAVRVLLQYPFPKAIRLDARRAVLVASVIQGVPLAVIIATRMGVFFDFFIPLWIIALPFALAGLGTDVLKREDV